MTTTTPLDDPDVPSPGDPAPRQATVVEVGTGGTDHADRLDEHAGPPVSLLHPIRRWESNGRRFLPGMWFPVAVWAVWRIVQFLIAWKQVGPVTNPFLSTFDISFNYDGERYLLIMHQGYANSNVVMPNTAFFPMVSWLSAPIWWITRSDAWTVHLVASGTAIAAFSTVWAVTKSWRDEILARRAVLLLAIMPSSLFLWAFYSEGLFIGLGAGAVVADRKGKHWLAACLFAPLAATRSVGILIPVVVVLARIIRTRRVDKACLLYAAGGTLGLVAVMFVMWKQVGSPFAFFGVQKDWGRGLSAPWTTIRQGVDNLYPKPETIMIPALVARNFDLWCLFLVGFPLFYVMGTQIRGLVRRRRPKDGPELLVRTTSVAAQPWGLDVTLIGWALILLPLCSTALASFNRFAMADWVIYPVYASLIGRLPQRWRWLPYVVMAGAGAWVTYLMVGRFAADRFVG